MRLDDLLEGYAQTLAAGQARDEFAAAAGFRNTGVSPYGHQGKNIMRYHEHGGPHYNTETGLMESAPGDEGFTQDPDFEGVSYEQSTGWMSSSQPEQVAFGDEGWDPHKATESTGDSTKVFLQYDMKVWEPGRRGRGGEWVTYPAGTEMNRSSYRKNYKMTTEGYNANPIKSGTPPGQDTSDKRMDASDQSKRDEELKKPNVDSSTFASLGGGKPLGDYAQERPDKLGTVPNKDMRTGDEIYDRPITTGGGFSAGFGATPSAGATGSGSQGGFYDQGEEFNTYMDAVTGNIQQTQEVYMKYGGKYKYPYGGKIR